MRYLSEEELIKINRILIETYSPGEMVGVKEPGALKMLVNAPKEMLFGEVLYITILTNQQYS